MCDLLQQVPLATPLVPVCNCAHFCVCAKLCPACVTRSYPVIHHAFHCDLTRIKELDYAVLARD